MDGNIHRAAQKRLIGGAFSLKKWNALAHNYWKGEDSGSIKYEILFDGEEKQGIYSNKYRWIYC